MLTHNADPLQLGRVENVTESPHLVGMADDRKLGRLRSVGRRAGRGPAKEFTRPDRLLLAFQGKTTERAASKAPLDTLGHLFRDQNAARPGEGSDARGGVHDIPSRSIDEPSLGPDAACDHQPAVHTDAHLQGHVFDALLCFTKLS